MAEPTTGTGQQDDGDAVAAGTPVDQDGNAIQTPSVEELQAKVVKLEQEKAQHLAEKSTLEQAKRELEARGASPGPSPVVNAQQEWNQLQVDILDAEELAKRGDAAARVALANLKMTRQMLVNQNQMHSSALYEAQKAAVPEERRKQVEEFFEANRNRFADLASADQGFLGIEYQEKQTTIKKRETELKDAEEQRRNGVRKTAVRGVTSEEHSERKRGTEMPFSEYRARVQKGEVSLVNQKDSGLLQLDYSR